ncbi:DNA replication complex GINS protein SLD5 C-terminus, putative [Leishmania lindenbergi]|uniref:DNA replication complex GINS protein SLD5 n=1 Tax=Leishmania lindenbergi TaxID=651832 RepID=A0AAW3B0G4_9TRYP
MFFEENLNDTTDYEPLLHDDGASVRPLSQVSDGGASSGAPSMGGINTTFGLDGLSLTPTVSGVGAEATTQSASAAAIQLLMEATANERFSPEVLPYPASAINTVTNIIQRAQRQLETMVAKETREGAARSLLPFRPLDIIGLELQRVQFFLCELLRCRLRKIDRLATSIYYEGLVAAQSSVPQLGLRHADGTEELSSASASAATALPEVRVPQRQNLSPKEQWVADRLTRSAHATLMKSGLQSMPAALQHLVPHSSEAEGLEILPEPDLGMYVFGVALEDLGVVNLGEGGQDALRAINAGELFLTPYRNFRPYVMSGQVRLV